VRRVPDERAYLYEIVQTIGSGPDLETILRGIVHVVTEATDCHACLIFFVQNGRLVLRCASAPYAHLAGKASMAIGEGLGGWVAKTRRSAFIKENALQDPRVLYFPEFEEERFQSLVSVPIFARGGDVIGVVNLHAEAPHEFAREDLDFLEHTASLVAGAVENARLYEEATARVALLTDLSRLAQRIASAAGVDDLLAMVVRDCRSLLDAERCEVLLLDADERLVLRAADPRRSAPSLDTRRLWIDALAGRPGPEEAQTLAEALWGGRTAGTPLIAPLAVGAERLGVLAVSAATPLRDAETVLAAIASHVAVALKQHQVIERLKEGSIVKEFFEALARGEPREDIERAAWRLGCELDAPHVVLRARPFSAAGTSKRRGRQAAASVDAVRDPGAWRAIAARLEPLLASAVPGLLFDEGESSLRALVRLRADDADGSADAVRRLAAGIGAVLDGLPIAVGLSNPCRGLSSFAVGFEEAQAAAEVGALIRGGPGVFSYEDLGPYKYVLTNDAGTRDGHQRALERLADYDVRRGTQLLRTLEGYLDGRGNVVGSSRSLFIHPNTLRQRLSRIEQITELDLEHDDWLSLAIAVKVVKLRLLRRSGAERRSAARATGGFDVSGGARGHDLRDAHDVGAARTEIEEGGGGDG
jgi:GAF domain-containing protein